MPLAICFWWCCCMFQGFRTLETLGANQQLTVTLSEQNLPEKNGGQKGALCDVYSSCKGEKLGECFEWSRSRLLPHIDNDMTIFLSLFGWCFTVLAHILCFCPLELPRCCESQWRSWHFKRASNPTLATVWDLWMGVSAEKSLRTSNSPSGSCQDQN